MKLKDYLNKKGISYRSFAHISGVEFSCLCKYANGQRRPGIANAVKIEKATKGAVKPKDFYDCSTPSKNSTDEA